MGKIIQSTASTTLLSAGQKQRHCHRSEQKTALIKRLKCGGRRREGRGKHTPLPSFVLLQAQGRVSLAITLTLPLTLTIPLLQNYAPPTGTACSSVQNQYTSKSMPDKYLDCDQLKTQSVHQMTDRGIQIM